MEKLGKKIITILLSISMLMTFTPTVAFAADLGSYDAQEVTEEVTEPSAYQQDDAVAEESSGDLQENEEITEPEAVPDAAAEEPTVEETPVRAAKAPTTIPDNAKFMVLISSTPKYHTSEEAGYVTGTVYDTYKGEIVIHDGYVHRSNMKVQVWMQNVASLGITTARSYVRNIATGMDAQNDNLISQITGLFDSFTGATVIGHADGKTVNYAIAKNGNTITAEPDSYDNANAVWHAIVNDANVESGLDNNEDSSALITAGSYIQVEDMILVVNNNINVNNLDNMSELSAAIRGAVEYKAAGNMIDGVKVHLAQGTELNLGTTYAKVKSECMTISMPDLAVSSDMKAALSKLQLNQDTESMVGAVTEFAGAFLNKMNNSTTNVYFSFDHNYGDPTYAWSEDHKTCTGTATCTDCGHVAEATVNSTSAETANSFPFTGKTTTYTATFEAPFTTQSFVDPGTSDDFKFAVSVSSKASNDTVGTVTGIVYPNYQGVLTIGEGIVNDGNVTVDVWMKDVASLNVDGVRHYTRSLNTGISPSADHSLDSVVNLFKDLEEATVIAKVEGGHAVTYTVINNGNVITATPGKESNARTVWHEIVNSDHVQAGVDNNEDSWALIKAGSYVQVEDMILLAKSDVKVDDLDKLEDLNGSIRAALVYKQADEPIQGVKVFLEKGTELNMGSSYARVASDCLTIKADLAATREMKDVLSNLQSAGDTREMMVAAFAGISEFCKAINETSTTVTFSFEHKLTKHDAKNATCTEDGYEAYYQCDRCGKLFSDEAGANVITEPVTLTKTDHDWGAATYVWSEDHTQCTATRICANDTEHKETETVTAKSSEETKPFPYNGTVTTYTATFQNEAFAPQTYTDLGQDQDFKFAVSVSSKAADGTVGAVTGIVYPNYQGVLTIGQGNVNQNNVTVDVWMRNVASLNVNGERHYTRTLNTGLPAADHSLDRVKSLFSGLEEATVIARVDGGSAVTYTIINEGNVITATPGKESKAREVWHQIVNDSHVQAGTDDNEDSYAVIKAGSYLQVEDMVLFAEQDVTVNNLDDMQALNDAIRNAVVYKAADKPIQGVKLYLAKDTELNMGTSYAKVTESCLTVTADVAATKEMKEALADLQSTGGVDGMIVAAFAGIEEFCDALNETTTTVTFYFGHDLTENAEVAATCEGAGTKAHWYCEHCGKYFSDAAATTEVTKDSLVIDALGHAWGTPTYEWAVDNSTCTATRVCANDGTHVETETVNTTSAVENKDFPFNGKVTTYTAKFENTAFAEQTKPVTEDGQDFKFAMSVSSAASDGKVGAVTGIVYPNYQGVVTIGEGLVNQNNVTVGFWMKDVASLGVEGVRSYIRPLNTGLTPADHSLDYVVNMFKDLHEATVIAKVEGGHSVTYTVVNEGRTITATPASENNARSVWHEIVNTQNINYGTDDSDDSSALIKAGSYIQVEDMILLAESDVKVDNLDDLGALEAAIRAAVVYKTADKPVEGVKIHVAKGTRLDMGTSFAEWKQNCMSITADVPATQQMKEALAALKSGNGTGDMMMAILGGISGFATALNDTTTTVVFSFGHDLTEHAAVNATCEEAGNTAYWECENCGKFFSDAEGTTEITEDSWITEAIGHKWNTTYKWTENKAQVVGFAICENDPTHIVVETVDTTNQETTAATCETEGVTTYTAEFTKEPFTTQTATETIDALGHKWGEAEYVWSEDHKTCTATAVCERNAEHKAEETVNATSVTIAATCLAAGETVYTATFTKEPFETQTERVAIAALDHDWAAPTYTWSADLSTCTAERICNRDASHKEVETVNAVPTVVNDQFPKDGSVTTYTATFTNPAFAVQTESKTTESRDYKFAMSVSSAASDGKVGAVTGIVYPDYQGVVTIGEGLVNQNNITFDFWMKDVASLNVQGERHYQRPVNTGMESADHSLDTIVRFFSDLHEATVITKVDGGHTVAYTVTNAGRTITATPASENNARSVWHEIVNEQNINAGVDENEDSSALIKAGSYIQVEDMILVADKDVAVDNLDNTSDLVAAIRNAVTYRKADKAIEGVKVYVAQGTRLDMGTSYAEWSRNCMSITADVPVTAEMKSVLSSLQSATNTNEMMGAVLMGMGTFCSAIDDTTTTVVFSFGHDLTKYDAAEETCTEPGNTEYYQCENCGKFFSDAEGTTEIAEDSWVVPAKGHDWDEPTYVWTEDNSKVTATAICKNDNTHVVTETVDTTKETTAATCLTPGKTVYTAEFRNEEVADLFKTQTKEVAIDALGHDWGEVTYTWSADHSTCTAERVCANDPTHVETEVSTATVVTVDPTPTEKGSKTYTAEFNNEAFESQVFVEEIPAAGYTYGEPTYAWADDNSTATATLPCNEDPEQNVTETVETTWTWKDGKEPTCIEGATKVYTATFTGEKFVQQTKEVPVEALGHDLVKTEAKDATCEAAGNTAYWTCQRCGEIFSDAEGQTPTTLEAVTIPATGHNWGVTYTWAENKASVVAVAICKNDPAHIVVETVVPESAVTTAATCETAGVTTYTATFTKVPFETQTATETIEALGHDWGEPEYVWADDNSSVTATAVCKRNAEHKAEQTVETTSEVTTAATCLADGVRTYTATFTTEPFETQTKTEAIPATEHAWGTPTYTWAEDLSTCTAERVCANDPAHVETQTVTSVPTTVYDQFPKDGSVTTYTATFTNPAFETQTETRTTESRDYKFAASVSSVAQNGSTGSVTGIVYPNYQGVLSINGDYVSKSNLTVGVWMNKVASLGVEGERHYEISVNTGAPASNTSISIVEKLFSELHEATVIAKVEGGHSVTYTVVNEGRKITADPNSENSAREVWHEIVNDQNINYGTDGNDDSSALIKAGSYIQVEDMILLAESDVKVDNLNEAADLENAIRDAVVYKKADKTIEGVKIHVAKGTRLDLGSSYAEWKQNCMSITMDIAATQEMKDVLAGLKNAEDVSEMIGAVVSEISQFCKAIDDTTTTVVFSFGHDLTKHEATEATCEDAGNIEYYQCENCGKLFKDAAGTEETTLDETVIAALGHLWDEPTYVWSEDHSTCTATRVCKRDANHVETENGKVTSTVTEATCEGEGKTIYTATFENEAFATQTEEVTAAATGHDWGEPTYTWAADHSTCTATVVCKNDATHKVTENGTVTSEVTTAATCEGEGVTTYTAVFQNELFETQTDTESIEALGHLWGTPTYTWSGDFSQCTAIRVCERDPSHVETTTVNTTSVTVDPTATENGKTTYTADFNEPFEDQTHEVVIPATGHTWGEPTYVWSDDNSECTATLPCTDDPTLTVTETVETTWDWVEGKEATCTEPGQKIYSAHFGNERFRDQTKTVDVEALGHDWGEPGYEWTADHSACTAKSVCKRDDSHVLTENGTVTSTVTTAATCEGEGVKTFTATFANETVEGLFETQTATEAIPATGHDWGTPVYTWSENLDKVVAVVICGNNPGHIIVETATVTKDVTAPGCEEAGKTVYTATFENELFETQTKTEAIPATGHDWGEPAYTWAEDNSTCTAKAVCKNDPTHILTENGKVTTVDTTPATCEEDGLRTYTATFENETFATQTTTGVIKALGHDWDTENIVFTWSEDHSSCTATFVCKRDETHRITLPCEVTSETVGNETTYTATVTFDGEEYTDVVKVDGVLRIYGKNRYKTSLKVAEYYKEIEGLEKFSTVVIATGTNFPDALTGADLAIRKHAPLIMIDGTSAAEVTAYIKANMAEGGKIYVLGGKGAVEDAWLAELSSFEITRLDGKNRYETNLSILRELEVKSGDLFVCTGMNFADALSSSAIDMPILIVGGQLTENQKTFLTEGSGWNFHLVGGAGAVSEEMEEELKAYGTVADRTGGKSRYETSTALALKFVPAATQAVLAVGDNYPDGLCGGPVAYLMGAPIILSGTRGAMCGDGIKYAKAQEIYAGIVLGGPSDAMINDDTVRLTFSMEPEDEVIVYKAE